MSDLRTAAQQALEALIWTTGSADFGEGGQAREGALKLLFPSIDALRAALKQEEEASAWLAERKEHWRKEREKAQAAKDQDPELSAALGWPGGISNPVLDRVQLLQMVAALRVSAQQASEALEAALSDDQPYIERCKQTITALRAALAQQDEPAREWVSMDEYKRLQGLVTSQGIRLMEYESKQPQQAEPVQQVKTCAWRDNLDAIYETECGNLHIVNDGTLEENGMKYCCYCGKEIKDESPT